MKLQGFIEVIDRNGTNDMAGQDIHSTYLFSVFYEAEEGSVIRFVRRAGGR